MFGVALRHSSLESPSFPLSPSSCHQLEFPSCLEAFRNRVVNEPNKKQVEIRTRTMYLPTQVGMFLVHFCKILSPKPKIQNPTVDFGLGTPTGNRARICTHSKQFGGGSGSLIFPDIGVDFMRCGNRKRELRTLIDTHELSIDFSPSAHAIAPYASVMLPRS